ncbi:unnamed protein product [Orchesella dallaii]|uniref:Palmitoyltransferase n=2 Tax=Orchesella dallaii TaxID=48710 RepID=A0ABP1PRD2_9HEXA
MGGGSWPLPVPKIPPENAIPVVLLGVFGSLSIRSPLWTFFSFLLLGISLHIIYKRIRKKCSSFYFSFTLCSLIGAHLVYELLGDEFMRITYTEYVTNIFLFTLTLYLMYRTKIAVGKDSTDFILPNLRNDQKLSVEKRKLAMAEHQVPSYNYCRRCQATIPGRDHHCVWLNVCIGRDNRYWFLACITIGACWILLITNVFLNSICYPVSAFSSGLFGRGADGKGPISWIHQYGLIPVTCPEAYVKTSVTICFVTSVYGLLVLLFLIAILIHQLRLLYKGVSYLELKYSGANKKARPATTTIPTSMSVTDDVTR